MKTQLCSLLLLTSQLIGPSPAQSAESFLAHEWGTFTSVQGADGIQLEWNPFTTAELPGFVYNANKAVPGNLIADGGKSAFRTLQRMETPVIYFYSDTDVRVNVAVDFKQGIVTEWYPAAKQSLPASGAAPARAGRNIIRWENIDVRPLKQNGTLNAALPMESSGSHYYAARDTDADFLQFKSPAAAPKLETEKFLFYRGVGSFIAPLTVKQGNDGETVSLQNTGTEPLGNLFLYSVRGNKAMYANLASLPAGGSNSMKLPSERDFLPLSDARRQIAGRMREALAKEGLFDREASAMVATWDDSWFSEQGTRVLYTLPRAWTDRVLPLSIEPNPRDVVRVMVGRAEAITPSMEWEVLKQVARYSDPDPASRQRVIADTRDLGFGRFLEPTTRRLAARVPGREFPALAAELIQAATKPAAKSVAAR